MLLLRLHDVEWDRFGVKFKVGECEKCQSFFFDAGEMDSLLDIIAKPILPKVPAIQFDVSKMTKLKTNCPVCMNAPLWDYEVKKISLRPA